MADRADPDVPALTERMRGLPDAERRAAIAAAPNVVGFGRFTVFRSIPRTAPCKCPCAVWTASCRPLAAKARR